MIQDDNIRGTTASAELRLQLNFGGQANYRKHSYLEKRMTGRVQRDVDVMTGFSGAPPIPLLPNATNIWYVQNNNNHAGDGSFEHPFSSLKDAENAATENDVIYIYYGNGTSMGQNKGIVLKEGQQLIGNGVDLILFWEEKSILRHLTVRF
ncbi:MAG: hypothetical protein JKY45_02110 [Emcibacter sp.]|nr:hypothetical protein [Emcibacter sp.]